MIQNSRIESHIRIRSPSYNQLSEVIVTERTVSDEPVSYRRTL